MIEIKAIKGTLLKTNNYIIQDNNNTVLIEATANLEDIKRELNGGMPTAIFLTHGHWDHFLNIEKYLKVFK